MKGKSRSIVAYFILGCAASFFSHLCIHSKTRKKKEIKKNYCVYFTGVFVNRPKKKKKKKKRKQQREEKKHNQLLDAFSQSFFFC
jgi:hypothetical protein